MQQERAAVLTSMVHRGTQEEPKGWTVHEYSAIVGFGRNCYERTRTNVLAWRVMDAVTLLVPMEDMQ